MSFTEEVLQLKQDFDDVYEAGSDDYATTLWNSICPNYASGYKRENYDNAFAYWSATESDAKKIFIPKINIVPTSAQRMFGYCYMPFDLQEQLDELGVVIDFSQCKYFTMCFYATHITRVGVIDLTNAQYNYVGRLFESSKIVTIDELIFNETTAYNYSGMFTNAKELVNLKIGGKITQNGFNVSDCTKLSHDSLMSIINHLETKTSGTFTLIIGSTNIAKLSDAEKAIVTQKGWTLA